MNFLTDLDGLTWALSIAAVTVSVIVIAIDIRDWRARYPILSRGKRVFLWGFAAVCAFAAANTIGDASDAKHLYCSGFPSVVRVRHGSRSADTWLVRVTNGAGSESPLLAVHDPEAIVAFSERNRDESVTFGYLDEPYYNTSGVAEFTVVDMAYSKTGDSFYHFDTRSHPYRVTVLFVCAILLFLTDLLNDRLSDALPDTENDYENYRDSPSSQATLSDLTALHLGDSDEKNSAQS